MNVKTRNGVFSNQGYGGGTFNQNTAFGAVNTRQSMRNHRYGDVSNLNAPYDDLSLQGLRGVGSLSGTSLGATDLDSLPVEQYPWLAESQATSALQQSINQNLSQDGYNLLAVDGKLGPRTCGALDFYGLTGTVGGSCDAHKAEFIAPTKVSGPAPIAPLPMVQTAPAGMPGWVWGALLGVGAVAAVVYMKKRKGRSVTLSTSYG